MQQRALAFQPAPAQPQTTKTTDDEPIIVQTMPHQQQMLDAFATGNYHRLLDAIQDTELESCLEPKSSRILGYKDWRDDGTFLLAQLRHTVSHIVEAIQLLRPYLRRLPETLLTLCWCRPSAGSSPIPSPSSAPRRCTKSSATRTKSQAAGILP